MDQITIDHSIFKAAFQQMVAKNIKSWNGLFGSFDNCHKIKDYSKQEVESIITSSSLDAQIKLSRDFFLKDGLYKRIIIYYATLLKYDGILIPNPSFGKQLSTPHIEKRYFKALDYLEGLHLQELLTNITMTTLVDGCYYGVLKELSKDNFVLIKLPTEYCRSRFKDLNGNDVVEFNVTYFDNIYDEATRKEALRIYPKIISNFYWKYKKGKSSSYWIKLPTNIGLCFPFLDDCRPFFLDLILGIIDYDEAKLINRERDLEEIRKIIVQKIPHLNDGQLLFEPPEAEEMHAGAVGMMAGNKNISILTTYADVDAVVSNTSSEATTNSLEKNLQNVYTMAGVSGQVFSPTGTQSLSTSITNDIALMMTMGRRFSNFISFIINYIFSNSNITFKYNILPITWYNTSQYITDALKLAQSGYSYLLPALAMDLNQKDLINIKMLENDTLKLEKLLIPLSSSYTQSSNPVGRPPKAVEEKSPKTLQNEESLNKQ